MEEAPAVENACQSIPGEKTKQSKKKNEIQHSDQQITHNSLMCQWITMFTFDTVINPVRRCFSSTRVRLKPQWNGMRRFRRGTAPRGEEACRRRSARSLRPRCSRSSSNSTNTRSLGHTDTETAPTRAGYRSKKVFDSQACQQDTRPAHSHDAAA